MSHDIWPPHLTQLVMSLSRNQAIIIAITRTGITTSQAANKFNMSTRQIRRIVAAWKTQGQAGITPRSRAPHTNPNTTPQHVKNQILALRETLWLTASCGHVPLMRLVVVGVFVLVFPGWFRIRLGGGSRLMSVGVCDCR